MHHVILDGSGSMTGPGKKTLQHNVARFLRQSFEPKSTQIWHWHEQMYNITPKNISEDIPFLSNKGKTNIECLAEFTDSLPTGSNVLILSDGFALSESLLSVKHQYYWIMIGADSNPSQNFTKKDNLTIVHPESLFSVVQLIINTPDTFDRPLVINPMWLNKVSNTSDSINVMNEVGEEDEW